jgi:serine/threonine protein kinase
LLDWSKRLKIIAGLTEGFVYLHKGSRFWIVHRDLKPHNILLDYNMIPKIADFGSARALSSDVAEERTIRVVGTRYKLHNLSIFTDSIIHVQMFQYCSFNLFCLHLSVVTKHRSMHLKEFTQ